MHLGYDSKLIDRKFLKVVKRRRAKTIANKEQNQMKERKFNFVTDFDPEFLNIMSAIRSCLTTLHEDPQCMAIFPKKAFRTSYRRGYANLKELLAPSKTDNKEVKKRSYKGSCSKCGKRGQSNRGKKRATGLNQCKVIREGTRFKSNSTGEHLGQGNISLVGATTLYTW